MIATQLEEAAQQLLRARRTGERLSSLPEPLRPTSTEEAYAIQQIVTRNLGEIGGWKVGAADEQARPLCAPMPVAGIRSSPARLNSRVHQLRGIEAEVAFRIRKNLPQRKTPYTIPEVIEAIDSCCAAIEELESRFANVNNMDALSLLADSQSHGGFVFGAAVNQWERIDWSKKHVELSMDGKLSVEGVGTNAAKDLLRLVTWLANEGSLWAGGLKEGQYITTGTWTGKVYGQENATVTARFRSLGAATLTFSDRE